MHPWRLMRFTWVQRVEANNKRAAILICWRPDRSDSPTTGAARPAAEDIFELPHKTRVNHFQPDAAVVIRISSPQQRNRPSSGVAVAHSISKRLRLL